jgi:putative membrane-bound dehydrogenase-like protein
MLSPMRTALLLPVLLLLGSALGLPAAAPPAKAPEVNSPLTPAQALREFRVAPGLRVELVAAEPDIQSPVAISFDEDGRLWVVEMRDYPNGPAKGRPPEGRIVLLEPDDSGRYKRTSVFADGLLFANGVLPWRGGALVTCAPHILALGDPGRTGKSTTREVLFEGFAAQNPQLRVSHPILGLDGKVYVANGLRGGLIHRAAEPDAPPVNLSGMDFRFDPLHPDRYEAITGMGQYGNTFDDWGHRFVCTNRNHLVPIVLPDRYVRRNPFLAPPPPATDNQSPGGSATVYPLSRNWTTASSHAGTFTASCGVSVYRGDLLGAPYRGSAFTCEPTGNLVHQEILEPDGAGFRGKPAFKGVEFLASPDDWFRPVMLAGGPDGAFYVVDMYRAVIEHPQFMPPELKERPDLLLGKDRGRIWRIVPDKPRTKTPRPRLSKASTAELVRLLAHPNAWWRTTAQRLLLERQDRAALEPLGELCRSSPEPLARLHAAWLLHGFDALAPDLLLRLLDDPHPRLREHAVRLAEGQLSRNRTVREKVMALAGDKDDRLRFQVALSLGEWDDDRIVAPLAQIAQAGAGDRWTRLAVASSVPRRAGALIVALCKTEHGFTDRADPARLTLLEELAALAGSRRDPEEVGRLLAALAALPGKDAARWQMTGLNGLAEGMGRRGTQLGTFLDTLPAERQAAARQAAALLTAAARLAGDRKQPAPERLAAVRLLAHAPWTTAGPVLSELSADEPVQEVRLAAVRALAAQPRGEVAGILLKGWPGYTPAVRRETTEALLRQPDRIRALLDAVEAGKVKPGDIDRSRSRQLVNHAQPDIRKRALKLLQGNLPADRKEVLARYQAALKLTGDARRGQAVFQKHCATCHRVAGAGKSVGPDLSDTLGKTPAALLNDIVDPNAAIDSNYMTYTVTTKAGKVFTGIIAAETASALTLKRAEDQSDVVLRQDIEEIASTGQSLMPEGLEKVISVEEMADLLSFLKGWRYLGGKPFGGP